MNKTIFLIVVGFASATTTSLAMDNGNKNIVFQLYQEEIRKPEIHATTNTDTMCCTKLCTNCAQCLDKSSLKSRLCRKDCSNGCNILMHTHICQKVSNLCSGLKKCFSKATCSPCMCQDESCACSKPTCKCWSSMSCSESLCSICCLVPVLCVVFCCRVAPMPPLG